MIAGGQPELTHAAGASHNETAERTIVQVVGACPTFTYDYYTASCWARRTCPECSLNRRAISNVDNAPY